MPTLKKFGSLSLLVLACACTSLQNSSTVDTFDEAYLKSSLVVGKTTETEVVQLLGNPGYTSKAPGGNDFWSYDEDDERNAGLASKAGGLSSIPVVGGYLGMGSAAAGAVQGGKPRHKLSIYFTKSVVSNYHLTTMKAN